MYYIVGLGNPGEEYENTRHNAGRLVLAPFLKQNNFPELTWIKKTKALESVAKVGTDKVTVIFPETYMNKSGASLISHITSTKKAHNLVVVYDDLDLPLGTIKISYNRSSGGHRGVESIIRVLKTQEFIRIRIGISLKTPSGKLKKPKGEADVETWIIGEFKPKEKEVIQKMGKTVATALSTILELGYERAMTDCN